MIYHFFSILPFSICLFWFIVLSFEYRRSDSSKRILTFFTFVCVILYFSHALYFNRYIELFKYVESIYAFCTLAVYPLYYLYIYRLTDSRPLPARKYLILSPAIVIGLTAAILYAMFDGKQHENFIEWQFYQKGSPPQELSWVELGQVYRIRVMKAVFVVQLVLVSYFGYKRLKDFDHQIKNFYADTEQKILSPIRKLLIIFIVFAVFSAAANHLGREFFIHKSWMIVFPSLIFSTMIFSVCYAGYKLRFAASEFEKDLEQANREQAARDAESDSEAVNQIFPEKEWLKAQLQILLHEKQIFLKKDLRISDVARLIGSNRTYISNFINQEMDMSFSDYINTFRVKHAQHMLAELETPIPLLEVGELSGFTNEVSFYRNFKKIVGCTPSNWRKLHGKIIPEKEVV